MSRIPKAESARGAIVYPDRDGRPMSDNTLQYQWIVTIEGISSGDPTPLQRAFVEHDRWAE